MMRFYCDVCEKELLDPEFVFDATIMENKEVFDIMDKTLTPRKQMSKKQIQLCKECYEKNIKGLLKI